MTLEVTLALARANPVIGLPRHAATIFDRRRMVSYGFTPRRTPPLAAKYSKNGMAICLHAEVAALANARQSVEGLTMYVARVMKDGSTALAKPCLGCARAIVEFGLGDVMWTE